VISICASAGLFALVCGKSEQFLDWFKTPMPSWGIFELTHRRAEELKPREPVYVRLKAPPGSAPSRRYPAGILRSEVITPRTAP
jgi:hypothetical protein